MVHAYRLYIYIGYVALILPLYLHSAELNQQASRSFASQARASIIDQQRAIVTNYQREIAMLTSKTRILKRIIQQVKQRKPEWRDEFVRFDSLIARIEERISNTDSRINELEAQEEKYRMCMLTLAEAKNRLLFRNRLFFMLKPIIKFIETSCADALNFVASDDLGNASAAIQKASDALSDIISKKAPVPVIIKCFNMYLVAEETWCIAVGKKIDTIGSSNASKTILHYVQRNELDRARLSMTDLRSMIEGHQKKLSRQQQQPALIMQLMSHLNNAWNIQALINYENPSDESEESHPERAAPLVLHEPIKDPNPGEIELEKMARDFHAGELKLLYARKAYFGERLQRHAHLQEKLDTTQQKLDYLQTFLPKAPVPPRALSPEYAALLPVVRAVLKATPAQSLPPKQKPRSAQPGILPPLVLPTRSIDLGKQTRVLPDTDKKPPRQPYTSAVYTFKQSAMEKKEALRLVV